MQVRESARFSNFDQGDSVDPQRASTSSRILQRSNEADVARAIGEGDVDSIHFKAPVIPARKRLAVSNEDGIVEPCFKNQGPEVLKLGIPPGAEPVEHVLMAATVKESKN